MLFPTTVVYKLTWLNKMVAKHSCALNFPTTASSTFLSENEVFPELIAKEPTVDLILSHIDTLFSNDIVRKQKIQACHILKKRLGNSNASAHAADAIIRTIS